MFTANPVQTGSPPARGAQTNVGAAVDFANAVNVEAGVTEAGNQAAGAGTNAAVNASVVLRAAWGAGADPLNPVFPEIEGAGGEGQADLPGETRPATDGANGKMEYVATGRETLEAIAAANGQTVPDVLLANPGMTAQTPIEEGTVVAFYDPTRLEIAREMAATTDEGRLNELIQAEIQYATGLSPTPDDLLPALQQEIVARRPGDAVAETAFADQAAWASQLWHAQGRTHEVMDRLSALAEQGDPQALQDHIVSLLRTVAETSPTADAVAGQVEVLRQFGPQTPAFAAALDGAHAYFTSGWPQEAARAIADAYVNEGPIAASQLLATYTSVGNADPLTAMRILEAAQPTVQLMIAHMGDLGGYAQEWPGNPNGSQFDMPLGGDVLIFDNLNLAADNADRSGQADAVIADMAARLNAQGFVAVQFSIEAGSGVVLSLEMLQQSGDHWLATNIDQGILDFQQNLRDEVASFSDTALEVTEPAALWGGLVSDPDAAFQATLDRVRPDGTTLREELMNLLGVINRGGYQLMRIYDGVAQYASYLSGNPDFEPILFLGTAPEEGADPALETALGMPSALFEALRADNIVALQDRSVLDPYGVSNDPSWFVRMVRSSSRSGWRVATGQPGSYFGTGTGQGLGLTLIGIGTYAMGFVNNVEQWNSGWRAQGLTILNGLGFMVEGGLALNGLYARANSLVHLNGQPILPARSALEYELTLGASASENSLLMRASKWHLRLFGILNLISAVDELNRGNPDRGAALTAAGLGTLASNAPRTVAGWVGVTGPGGLAKIALVGNLATLLGSGYLLLDGMREHMERAAYTEPFQRAYLEAAGIRPEIAEVLGENDYYGRSIAYYVQDMAAYLNLEPGEMLSWLNARTPEEVRRFMDLGIDLANDRPDDFIGSLIWDFSVRNPNPALTNADREAIIQYYADQGYPLPDRRGETANP